MTTKQIEKERQRILDLIHNAMKEKEISQSYAADLCGWKQPTVPRMLSGRFGPKLDNIIQLCDAIGVRIEIKADR